MLSERNSQPIAATTASEGDGLVLENKAGESRSPYVRGHKSNPVKWQLWSPETLALAAKHNRLIFLSVGYSACHWCHVMERESFENAEVANLLNSHFIPIKLDREERPDLDRIYMNYVQATIGGGGWPLNVFLTPDLQPLFGGTYWPGPGATTASRDADFVSILKRMEQLWSSKRQRCISSAKEITEQLRQFSQEGLVSRDGINQEEEGDVLDLELLDEAYEHFARKYDNTHAGFGLQPKFPTPINLQFLLSLSQYPTAVKDVVGENDVEKAKTMALSTLKAMWRGGIKDQIGHGFARYSVTRDWSLPHFEKMLYDQSQLLQAYLEGYIITKDQDLLEAVIDIATYLTTSPIAAPNGGFFSSEDADSQYRSTDKEKREGAFYVWTLKEFNSVLGERDGAIAARYWNVQTDGNVQPEFDAHDELINQNVLSITANYETLAKEFGVAQDDIPQLLQDARKKLVEHREQERPRPLLDDKIVLSWNGLAIGALARTAAVLKSTHADLSKHYLETALKAAQFVKEELADVSTGEMRRVWREGLGDAPAFADDYAFLISGLCDLYETTWDEQWLKWADELQKTQNKLFWDDGQGGFFSTAAGQQDLILRLKDGLDNAEPSTNGQSARNLYRLSSFLDDSEYITMAQRTLHAFEAEIMQHPFLFVGMLEVVVAERLGVKSIVMTGKGEKVDHYEAGLRKSTSWLRTMVRLGPDSPLEWLKSRNKLLAAIDESKPTVQVCEDGACKLLDI